MIATAPQLKLERVLLRIAEHSDFSEILEFYLKNKSFFSQYDPPFPDDFFSEDYWKNKIHDYQNLWLQRRELRFLIFNRESNQLMGMVNFTNFERGPFQCCRLGYKLGEEFNGQGFMSESLMGAIKYLFSEMNLHRIEANYLPSNIRSEKLLMRVGFKKEGLAKEYLFINGAWRDHVLTSLTNSSWNNF